MHAACRGAAPGRRADLLRRVQQPDSRAGEAGGESWPVAPGRSVVTSRRTS